MASTATRALRPWLTATKSLPRTKCLPRQRPRLQTATRTMYTSPGSDKSMSMESQDDWQQMQENRARFKLLYDLMDEYGSSKTRNNTFQPYHAYTHAVGPSQATVSALMAAGAHLGHTKALMNPNFLPYTFGVRAGLTIIDLDQTVPLLRRAANVTRAIAQNGGTVLFVGTRSDLRDIIRHAAGRLGDQGFYVADRWLPGTLTNSKELFPSGTEKKYRITPDLVVFLNPIANMNAIRECALQHIPTIGIVDSNADPRIVMYPIPANDDSQRTAQLVSGVLSIAGKEGIQTRREDELDAQRRKGRMITSERLEA